MSHANICTLFDVGEQGGTSFLVMEHLEGETLADRLAKGPVPIAQALTWAMQFASALNAAHRQGILHRDLKPGNVMVTASGVKLLDFGLAKIVTGAIDGSGALSVTAPPTQSTPLTAQGTRCVRMAVSCDMVAHMKTTIEIAGPVLEEAKRLARKEGVTLRVLVEEGLRTVVAARGARKSFRLKDAGFAGKGVQPGMEEGRWFEIRDLIYEGRGA